MQSSAYLDRGSRVKAAARSGDQNDRCLLSQVAEHGDKSAFEQLYHSYRRRLGPFLYRFTQDTSANEEVFNDVMLAVWRRASSYNGKSQVSTWVFAIAYRHCLKYLRARVTMEELPDAADDNDTPGAIEAQDLVDHALSRLSPEHRMVIELWYFQGNSYREIAVIADCPENTVKTRVFHARRRLREIMGALDERREKEGT